MSETTFDQEAGSGNSYAPLSEQAKQVATDLKQKASAAAEALTYTAKHEADEFGNAAKEIVDGAADRVKSAVNDQKTASADYLDTVAHAICRAAGEFDADVPQAAQYIRRTGSQLSSVAKAVRKRDVRELVAEVEDVARRQPALFFGGAIVLGFAAVRFLKSAPPQSVQVKAEMQ